MVIIRPTTEIEAELLPGIERSAGLAFLQVPGLAWIADDEVMGVEQHLKMIRIGTSWVAVDTNGDLVGFLSSEVAASDLHIWIIAVSHEKQGLGYGRLLMDEALRCASQRGLEAVTLTTFRSVKWNEPFYQKLGFETLGPEQMSGRLKEVLRSEAEHGMPGDMRCAMRHIIGSAQ